MKWLICVHIDLCHACQSKARSHDRTASFRRTGGVEVRGSPGRCLVVGVEVLSHSVAVMLIKLYEQDCTVDTVEMPKIPIKQADDDD